MASEYEDERHWRAYQSLSLVPTTVAPDMGLLEAHLVPQVCILLDVMMPGMDGFEVTRRIHGRIPARTSTDFRGLWLPRSAGHARWGGHGYAHILENIVPRLRREGIIEEQIRMILVENPKRFLSW